RAVDRKRQQLVGTLLAVGVGDGYCITRRLGVEREHPLMPLTTSEVKRQPSRRAGTLTNLTLATAGLGLDRDLPRRHGRNTRGLRRKGLAPAGGPTARAGRRARDTRAAPHL